MTIYSGHCTTSHFTLNSPSLRNSAQYRTASHAASLITLILARIPRTLPRTIPTSRLAPRTSHFTIAPSHSTRILIQYTSQISRIIILSFLQTCVNYTLRICLTKMKSPPKNTFIFAIITTSQQNKQRICSMSFFF